MTMRRKAGLLALSVIAPFITTCAQTQLTLREALHVVKTNNPWLKPERLNTGIAQSDLVTAGLRPNLVLNNQTLQLVNDRYFEAGTKFSNPHNRQVWWQLTKEFQLGGQRRYKQEVAGQNVVVTQQNYMDLERNLLLDAGVKWLDVWYNKRTLELIDQARANIDTLVGIQQIRLKNQVISSSDLARTELLQEQYDLQFKNVDQTYRNEQQNLRFLLGGTDSITVYDGDSIFSMNLVPVLDSLVAVSYASRADVAVAKANIELSRSNIKLQRSLAVPVPELGVIWNPQNTVPYVGIFGTIDLPFFNRNQGEIKKSRIQLEQSEQRLSAVQLQVQTEVQTALRSYQVNKATVEKYSGILRKSAQVLESVKYAYTRGGTTIIDFLEAQRNWFDTEKLYCDALYNYRKSYLQLLCVTGLINQL